MLKEIQETTIQTRKGLADRSGSHIRGISKADLANEEWDRFLCKE